MKHDTKNARGELKLYIINAIIINRNKKDYRCCQRGIWLVVKVFLFGSRTDDSKRGGDIDLLIRTETQEKLGFMGRVLMRAKLKMVLGDQKIDIVGDHEESDFVQSIINGAILLNDAI